MAGVGRFELPRARVKVLCLTAWRYPNNVAVSTSKVSLTAVCSGRKE